MKMANLVVILASRMYLTLPDYSVYFISLRPIGTVRK